MRDVGGGFWGSGLSMVSGSGGGSAGNGSVHDDLGGHVVELAVGVGGQSLEQAERLILIDIEPFHDDAHGGADPGPAIDRDGQLLDVLGVCHRDGGVCGKRPDLLPGLLVEGIAVRGVDVEGAQGVIAVNNRVDNSECTSSS